MARLIPLVLLLAACGSAPYAGRDFGLVPLSREQFPELDSALRDQQGHALIVHAQRDLGQTGPVPESMVGFVRFEGNLISAHDGWVSLFRAPDDTVRVSKGHITSIWDVREAPHGRPVLLGAALFALTTVAILQVTRAEDRPTAQNQFLLVSGAAALGGVLGNSLFGGARRGEQLYPARRPRE